MKKSFIMLILAICSLSGAVAQNSSLRTGYFNDRMYMNHKINPALVGDYGYVTIPMLGEISFGMNTNLGLNDFLFPSDGELKTFLHPDISTNDFLSGLNKMNTVSQSFSLDVLSFGFFGFGGYNTFDFAVKQNASVYIPEDLFVVLKDGSRSIYDLSGMGVKATSYAELSFGHSRKIMESLTVGAKVKALVGLAYVDITTNNTYLTMTDDVWALSANATGEVAAGGAVIDLDENDDLSFGGDNYTPSVGGFGAAIDLGAVYTMMNDRLKVSLALTDIGFISWKEVSSVSIKGGDVEFLSYSDEYDYDTAGDDISDRLESLSDDIADMFEIQDVETGGSSSRFLTTTLTAGVEYTLLNDIFSFGLLSTTNFGPTTETELMGVVGITPVKAINISFSGSVSTMGSYCGCLLNISPRSFLNFYIGADCMVTKVTPQYIPVKAGNVSLSFGLAIPIGGSRDHMDKALM